MKIKHKNWKRKAKCVAVTLIAPFLKIAAILHFVDIFHILGSLLKCYNDGEEKIVKCDENLGYRTCFIRYNESEQIRHNFKQQITIAAFLSTLDLLLVLKFVFPFSPEGGITGRGCSTKDKVQF